MTKRVHDHAGVGDALAGRWAFVGAEAKAELVNQAVPLGLRAAGCASDAGADDACVSTQKLFVFS